MAHRTNSKRRGAGYIEVLVSSLILAISLLAALSLYGFSMNMIDKTGDEGVAYNIGRKTLEDARQLGFDYHNLPEGTTTMYWDSLGSSLSESSTKSATSRFQVDRVVTSDKTSTVGGVSVPAPDAIRTVTVTVYLVSTGETIDQCGTFLVRSGV